MTGEPFAMVYESVLRDRRLIPSEKVTFSALALRADGNSRKAWPSQDWIADVTGSSRRTVRTHLDHLVELGYVVDLGRYRRSDGTLGSKTYLVYPHAAEGVSEPPTDTHDQRRSEPPSDRRSEPPVIGGNWPPSIGVSEPPLSDPASDPSSDPSSNPALALVSLARDGEEREERTLSQIFEAGEF